MRALDARAIRELGIPGPRLMEAAGTGAARLIAAAIRRPCAAARVVILCGKGNNGGDGFVVARRLRAAGARVRGVPPGPPPGRAGRRGGGARRYTGRVDGDRRARRGSTRGRAPWRRRRGRGRAPRHRRGRTARARGLPSRRLNRATGRGGRAPVGPVLRWSRWICPPGSSADRGALTGPTVRATLTATFAGHKRALLLRARRRPGGRGRGGPHRHPAGEVERERGTFLLEDGGCAGALARAPRTPTRASVRPSPRGGRLAGQDRRGGARGARGAPERRRAGHGRHARLAAAHRRRARRGAHDGGAPRDRRGRARDARRAGPSSSSPPPWTRWRWAPGSRSRPEAQALARALVAERAAPHGGGRRRPERAWRATSTSGRRGRPAGAPDAASGRDGAHARRHRGRGPGGSDRARAGLRRRAPASGWCSRARAPWWPPRRGRCGSIPPAIPAWPRADRATCSPGWSGPFSPAGSRRARRCRPPCTSTGSRATSSGPAGGGGAARGDIVEAIPRALSPAGA